MTGGDGAAGGGWPRESAPRENGPRENGPEGRAPRGGADSGEPLSDEQLLEAHNSGDPEAFGVLIRRHHSHLWAVALRTTGDPDDAADALQDALLKAHQMSHRFRADAKVTSWLHRIVVNASLDRLRRNRVRATVVLPPNDGLFMADPHDQMGAVDLSVSIGDALHHLPATQRAVVVAVDIEGFTLEEVATRLGIPVGTVKSRLSRGRAKLAGVLGHLRQS